MKILITLLLIQTTVSLSAQSREDSIVMCRNKATVYFRLMYQEEKFDSASAMWGKRMKQEIKKIYYDKKDTATDSILYTKAKAALKKHYLSYSNFTIERIEKEEIYYSNTIPVYIMGYECSEKAKGKTVKSPEYFTLMFNNQTAEWEVIESKGLRIILQ